MLVRRDVVRSKLFWDYCFVEEGDEVLILVVKLDRYVNILRLSFKRIGKGYIIYKFKVSRMVNGIKKKIN